MSPRTCVKIRTPTVAVFEGWYMPVIPGLGQWSLFLDYTELKAILGKVSLYLKNPTCTEGLNLNVHCDPCMK